MSVLILPSTTVVPAVQSTFEPVYLLEVELSEPLPIISAHDVQTGRHYRHAQVLVRLHTRPLGVISLQLDKDYLTPDVYADKLWQVLHQEINNHLHENGLEPDNKLTREGLPYLTLPYHLKKRKDFLQNAPFVSVIVCTRDRTEKLVRCLDHLLQLEYPNYEILVVDNAPKTQATYNLIQQCYQQTPKVIRYVRENRPGLSWARNCGLQNSQAEIVAYIDDDELADPHWLTELTSGFNILDNVACVTGVILPGELETQPQGWFEQFGGHSKGRGFKQAIFNTTTHNIQNPLFPVPPFGAGGNMAFKVSALRALGGFDPTLGAGTPTRGGEDSMAFFQVLTKGYTLVYKPEAIVFHFHYREYADLRQQLYGYGTGLTAFYTDCLFTEPKHILRLLGMFPTVMTYLFSRRSLRVARMANDYPKDLTRTQLKGMVQGPFAYFKSQRYQNRIKNQA